MEMAIEPSIGQRVPGQQRKLKIAVCIPFYKVMEAQAVTSLISMLADIHNRGDIYVPVFCHNMHIEKARYMLFEAVIKNSPDTDYILCIDTDHVYKASALYALIDAMEDEGLAMLSAAYTCRNVPGYYAHCRRVANGYQKIQAHTEEQTKGIEECDIMGFGFVVFRTPFVKAMMEKHGEALFASRLEGGRIRQGDDKMFCELAIADGHRPRFHAGVKVGHISSIVL